MPDKTITTNIFSEIEKTYQGLSELGKHILATCDKAYVNECGQVIDPCHVWWSEPNDPTKW